MGNTQSVNVAKSVTDIFAKVSSEMIQQTELSTNNSQIISISNTGGDVTISGNTFTQTAYINMSALMDALANQSAVDKITAEMEQLAKSIVSGFNFFTYIYIYIHSPYRILAAVHFLSCLSVLFSTFVRGKLRMN